MGGELLPCEKLANVEKHSCLSTLQTAFASAGDRKEYRAKIVALSPLKAVIIGGHDFLLAFFFQEE